MKKIDKLIIKAFLGPFILTFLVIVFILLTVQMMNYVDEIFGKDLKWIDLGRLIFHFSVFQTPIAFPLAVMLASLMTFGNLGEHFELTAIKSAGISLVRALLPIYILVMAVTIVAFYSNNYFVPYSALKAYSLLYDIRQKKPALDIQPGQFYAGIENYKIKVDEKLADGKTLKGLTIYDHSSHKGNNEVIVADSGRMYTIMDDQYLKFELFNGTHYVEGDASPARQRLNRNKVDIRSFTRTSFDRSDIIFDLSSFGMSRTDEGLFASNRLMRNFSELILDLDSLQSSIYAADGEIYGIPARYFSYGTIKKSASPPPEIMRVQAVRDSLRRIQAEEERAKEMGEKFVAEDIIVEKPINYTIDLSPPPNYKKEKVQVKTKELNPPVKKKANTNVVKRVKTGKRILSDELIKAAKFKEKNGLDSSFSKIDLVILARYEERASVKTNKLRNLKTAVATARQIKSKLTSQNTRIKRLTKEYFVFDIQWHKMLASAFACISMFLIGAPLGAIIKRGGIGFPVIVSVIFFIIYYVISIGGEKYAKAGNISVITGVWAANFILLPIGLILLRQAKNDVRLLEADFYKVMLSKFIAWVKSLGKDSPA